MSRKHDAAVVMQGLYLRQIAAQLKQMQSSLNGLIKAAGGDADAEEFAEELANMADDAEAMADELADSIK